MELSYSTPMAKRPCSSHLFTIFLTTLILFAIFKTSPIPAAAAAASTTTTPSNNAKYLASLKFIKVSCNTTTYPPLCYSSLSPYASTVKTSSLKLCNTALTITIKAARRTSAVVSSLSKQKGVTKMEAGTIRDCIENVQDTIDELKQSLTAMSSLSGPDKAFQMDNAKTWASAAITDENTCLDAFSGRKVDSVVKNKIRRSILNVAKLSSNALALINHLNY